MTDPLPPIPPSARPRVDLAAINHGWLLLRQQTSSWIMVSLVILTVSVTLSTIALGPMVLISGGLEEYWESEPFRPFTFPWIMEWALFMPLYTWLTVGVYGAALRQVRGGRVKPDDLFRIGRSYWAVLGYTVMFNLPWFLPDSLIALILIMAFALSGRLLFAVPLMIDRGLGLWEAIRTSWRALQGQWLRSIGFVIICGLAAFSGLLLFGVGLVLTFPLWYLPIAVLYRRFFPDSQAGPYLDLDTNRRNRP